MLLIVALGVVFYYKRSHNVNQAVTTSKSPTAQSDYKTGANRTTNQGGGTSQGGAIDTGGRDVVVGQPGITSASGDLTVQTPAKSALITPGDTLSGTTKSSAKVQYRIIDGTVGVLGQGSLDVVNGAFSGTLQFKARASSGRIDVFNFNASGEEVNNIEIPVGFKE